MHLIVTRPQADGDRLKARLEAIGHTASVVPLLTIQVDSNAAIPDKPWQALAITSANALSALSAIGFAESMKAVPVFAVGPASARLARETGFTDVRQADGDLDALQKAMRQSLTPGRGPILYLTGKVRSGDLAASLGSGGFSVDRVELYDAVAATHIPSHAKNIIRSGKANGVVLYSARTADIWLQLVRQAGLQTEAERMVHFCLSPAVAEKIRSGPGRNVPVVISGKPGDDAMLQAIADTASSRSVHTATPGKGATMANRKSSSRKAGKPARPTVIDARATEVKSADTAEPATSQTQKSGTPPDTADAVKSPEKSAAPGNGTRADTAAGIAPLRDTPQDKPADKPSPAGSAPAKKSSHRGKLLTGALVAMLVAGIGVGGYLYREHGARLFGSNAAAIDVGAIEGQAMEAIGKAQSASNTASAALAETQALTQKIAGLEQQINDARNAAPTPGPQALAAINAVSGLARSATSGVEAVSAKAGELEAGLDEVRKEVADLKTALQSAADAGAGAGQAEINLKVAELSRRIDQLAAANPQPDNTVSGEIATLRDQLAAASTRIEKLEAADPPSGNADVSTDVSALGALLSAATARISDLESRLAEAVPGAPGAEPQPVSVDTGKIAGQLTALSDMVNQGKPYQAELDALQETANLTLNLPALSANAGTGIMTVAQLKQNLADLKTSLDAMAASKAAGTGTSSGLWGTITARLASVVKVRKVTGGADWTGHVAAAMTALEAGGLDAAIAALDSGGPSAPADVAGWIIEARKRLSAGEELQKLPQIILGHLPAPVQ